jgi:hypothetical protein
LPSTSRIRWITNITSGRPALQRPGQDALAELGDLLAVAQHDGVLADKVDPADMAVQINPHTGPVQPRRDLFDMGRFAGAVITLDHDAAVVGEAGQDGERGIVVEHIGLVQFRHMVGAMRERRDLHIGIDAEGLAHRYRNIRCLQIVGALHLVVGRIRHRSGSVCIRG